MKRTFCWFTGALLLANTLWQTVVAQTLFTYGNKPVSAQSFLQAFNKNPGNGNRKELMEDYLPLFINYVLKVQYAYDIGLDSLPTHLQEMAGYKTQLAENYLLQVAGGDKLVDEKMQRMQTDVLLGHIFIRYQNKDTASALAKAKEAYSLLKKGELWDKVAVSYTTESDLKQNKGKAGWITAFTLPGAYEDLIYGLPKGGFTQPIAASEGVHIFSKLDTRKGVGTVQVSQILIAKLPGISQADRQKRIKLVDSLYEALKKGEGFEKLVSLYSDDRTSKYTYGLLPAFGPATYDPVFEAQAFGLKNKGDISKPFETDFGWHILKLTANIPPPALTDTNAREVVRNRLMAEGYLATARAQYTKQKLPAMKYKPGNFMPKKLQQFTDSLLIGGNTSASGLTKESPVFYFGKTEVPMADWIAFVRVKQVAGKYKAGGNTQKLYNEFIESKAADYLPLLLDEIEPSFAAQFKEFKDANLLFEAMERRVWGPSQTDTAALEAFYKTHSQRYIWDDNLIGISTTTSDSIVASEIQALIQDDMQNWRKASNDYSGLAFIDSGRFEIKVLQSAGHTVFLPGKCSPIIKNTMDNSFSFIYVLEMGASGTLRSFDEARGFVVNDYQQTLEEIWVNELKKKYPVKINELAWQQVLKQ